MRHFGPALFALLLVGVAFFGSYSGMQLWEARERDAKIQHDATQNRYNPNPPHNSVTPADKSEAAPEKNGEHKNRDFWGPEWFLVWVSILLAGFTAALFFATSKLARDSRELSIKATGTLASMERAYLTGGGNIEYRGGRTCFRVEVANYGKTAAYLSGFYVKFATRNELNTAGRSLLHRHVYDDRIPPGERARVLQFILIDHPDPEFIYGGFCYRDLEKNRHVFRFILRIQPNGHTRPDVSRGVGEKFRRWT